MGNLLRGTVIAIAFLCLLSSVRQAQACSCASSSLERALTKAEHVALVEIRDVRAFKAFPHQLAHFSVVRSFKGHMGQIADLRSGNGGGDCGVPLQVGRQYLVYLVPDSNVVSICYGLLGPLHMTSAAQDYPAKPALDAFFDSLAAHLQQGAALAEPSAQLFIDPGSRGGPPPPPPPPEE